MSPQTVNASYDPSFNEMTFPAGILEPPFFDPAADPAVNYGAIGAVIGHEMTHGFDDEGRKYDGAGVLSAWLTDADAKEFTSRAAVLGRQFRKHTVVRRYLAMVPGILSARTIKSNLVPDRGDGRRGSTQRPVERPCLEW